MNRLPVHPMLSRIIAGLMACALAGPAAAQGGLSLPSPDTVWPRWQARLVLQATHPVASSASPDIANPTLRGARLLGDYYFTGPGFGEGHVAGGFRATSGLLVGPRGNAWGPSAEAGGALSVGVRRGLDNGEERDSLPYLGVGYTGLSTRGGWGFSADLGVMASPDGSGLSFGRALQSLGFDDRLRDLRLAPVLQIGVRYAF